MQVELINRHGLAGRQDTHDDVFAANGRESSDTKLDLLVFIEELYLTVLRKPPL